MNDEAMSAAVVETKPADQTLTVNEEQVIGKRRRRLMLSHWVMALDTSIWIVVGQDESRLHHNHR